MQFKMNNQELMKLLQFLCGFYLIVDIRAMSLNKCQPTIDAFSSNGAFVDVLNKSRITIPRLMKEFQDGHELRFELKTRSQNGVVFYLTREGERDFIALDLVNGHPRYHIRCKRMRATLTLTGVRIDDNKGHQIIFRRKNNRGKLFVDNMPYFHSYRLNCGAFTSVTFGGVDPSLSHRRVKRMLNTRHGHFEGCVWNIDFSTGVVGAPLYQGVSECI